MMALFSAPADPPSSANTDTAAAATATTARLFTTAPPLSRDPRPQTSLFPHSPPHYHHSHVRLPSQQPLYASQAFANLAPRVGVSTTENRGILYPVASSGRGFLPKAIRSQSADQIVTNANQVGFLPPPAIGGAPYSHTFRTFVPHSDRHGHLIRPLHVHRNFLGSTGDSGMSGAVNGVPISGQLKVAPSQASVSECNSYRDQRGRSREHTFASVRDRKVKICKGSSLYGLCRSWLRNGFPEEYQIQHVDGVRLLPRPMPTPMEDAAVKKEDSEEEEEISVENLSPKDLLQRHVKRGKRVRARLREERLQRIERYKIRLALLLPPHAEQQQLRNDTAAALIHET